MMRVTAIAALVSVVFCASCSNESSDSHEYVPFPPGFGYMERLGELQKATDEGDDTVIRDHAWKMWVGIMQPDSITGWPLWYSWGNTTEVFSASSTDPSVKPAKPLVTKSLRDHNLSNTPSVSTQAPIYCLHDEVKLMYPNTISLGLYDQPTIGDGKNFQNNGDIMIATESLSKEAYASIRDQKLYLQSTLDEKYKDKQDVDIAQRSIVTKHMYWPVKAKGLTALPVWKNQIKPSNPNYAGYEIWDSLVAIDPSGEKVGQTADVEFLYGVRKYQKDWYCSSGSSTTKEQPTMMPTVSKSATVYSLNDFYFHQVTEADWASFNDKDKAIITASSYWANNQPFNVGDYLVTVAMHVNTKELPSWTLQSVWWADDEEISRPNNPYGKNRPVLPHAQGPWQHYLMTDSYAVPPNDEGKMDIAVNPYIEGVSHPVATSCRNCHIRAGWPTAADNSAGTASYQNPDCPKLLGYLTPETACLKPLSRSDYLWILPDRAIDH
ncbi:hypothetical protein HWQ46_17435 [Shewanella sp. D64]|uniref:hypothetical protein n=1 Tax=unclassified Shewanella TaxID=196818 RepID=UPI0022BA2736|nr:MULTISPECIES: hypothetical protein [unclassified Shewanella]MEC4727333.1 hypothetical protein [Shewanella sp. D64]MEC4739488.1 hypothetical protein [Shewanella sp. E94]WBJ96816.1 hypothetical protein HWQ47_06770 [Shewanella sp. MTB7]